jgi:hypothetical protein
MVEVQNKTVTGFDAKITLNDMIVGRAESLKVDIKNDLEVIHEVGNRKPVEIKEKKFTVNGTLGRMYIDNELVKKILTKDGMLPNAGEDQSSPYFNIQAYIKNPSDGSIKKITVFNAKFSSWGTEIKSDGSVLTESPSFDALDVKIE